MNHSVCGIAIYIKTNYKILSQRISCNTRIRNTVVHRYSSSNNNDNNNKKCPLGIVVVSGRC